MKPDCAGTKFTLQLQGESVGEDFIEERYRLVSASVVNKFIKYMRAKDLSSSEADAIRFFVGDAVRLLLREWANESIHLNDSEAAGGRTGEGPKDRADVTTKEMEQWMGMFLITSTSSKSLKTDVDIMEGLGLTRSPLHYTRAPAAPSPIPPYVQAV